MSNVTEQEMLDYLSELKKRFLSIDPKEYYMSYSGGRDSHFLYWFIRIYLKEVDPEAYEKLKAIEIVAVNTRMEHPEVLKRMMDNADVVVIPNVKPFEYKADIGIPCFTKLQDSVIRKYQRGNRSFSTLKFVHGFNSSKFSLNKIAQTNLLNGTLHKVGDCCKVLKKDPLKRYVEGTGKKAIIGVRADESILRQVNYTSYITRMGKLTPIFDLTDVMQHAIEERFNIEVPEIYKVLRQTGCMGCPYGRNIVEELKTLPKARRDFTIALFKESYDVKGVKYQEIQDVEQFSVDEILAARAKKKTFIREDSCPAYPQDDEEAGDEVIEEVSEEDVEEAFDDE